MGNSFLLKPKRGSTFEIAITEIVPGRKFTDCTNFPGAKMFDTHELVEVPGGVRLTSTLSVTGPLGFLWRKLVAEKVAKSASAENATRDRGAHPQRRLRGPGSPRARLRRAHQRR